MPRIVPIDYKKLVRVFEKSGFRMDRQEGDHLIYVKEGIKRPIVIPMYKNIPVFIIKNNLKTAKITREEYFILLKWQKADELANRAMDEADAKRKTQNSKLNF